MKRVTIKDIAQETGLSIATVSYVLNGKNNVLEETKSIVNDAAKKLGYVRNFSARSLVMNRSNLIGVVIPQTEPGSAMVFENPFYSEMLSSIEFHARQIGYHVIVSGTDADEKYYNLARERNLDGIIIIGAYSNSFYEGLKNSNIPIVMVDSYIEEQQFKSVKLEDCQGAYLATSYLIEHGHTDIAFLAGNLKDHGVGERRLEGYEKALNEHNIPFKKENILTLNTDFDSGRKLGKRLVETTKATAAFCVADILAFGLMKELNSMGIRIPEDISVMGFDNLKIGEYCSPGLTTVGQNIFEKGEKAVELLINSIEEKENNVKEIILPTTIVERESVRFLE